LYSCVSRLINRQPTALCPHPPPPVFLTVQDPSTAQRPGTAVSCWPGGWCTTVPRLASHTKGLMR
jgi:hypothetical protein